MQGDISLKEHVDALFNDRREWETLWDTVYSYVAPERQKPLTGRHNPGSTQSRVFDSTAIQAAERLNNLLITGLIPPWMQWFRVMPGNEVRTQEAKAEMRPLLQETEDKIGETLKAGRFYQEMQPVLMDRIVGGSACMEAVVEDNQLRFKCVPLGEIAFSEDAYGRVAVVARKTEWTTTMLLYAYEGQLDETWKQLYRPKPQDRHTVLELEERQYDGQYHWRRVLNSPQASPVGNEKELESHTKPLQRLMVTRWTKIPGVPYGRGPAIQALGDIRALNKIKELSLKNAALAVSGVYTVVNDGVINPYTVTVEPGARIPVASNNPNERSIEMLPTSADFDVAMFSMEDLQNAIQKAFMANRFTPSGRTPLSATEIAERTQMIAHEAGATIARLQNELVEVALQHCLRFLRQQGEIPEALTADGAITEIRYVSRLSQAQWAEERSNILNLAQVASAFGEFDTQAGLVIDTSSALRRVAALDNLPTEIMRSPEEVEKLIEQAAQARALQAQAQVQAQEQEQEQ